MASLRPEASYRIAARRPQVEATLKLVLRILANSLLSERSLELTHCFRRKHRCAHGCTACCSCPHDQMQGRGTLMPCLHFTPNQYRLFSSLKGQEKFYETCASLHHPTESERLRLTRLEKPWKRRKNRHLMMSAQQKEATLNWVRAQ